MLLSTNSDTDEETMDEALRCNNHGVGSKLRNYMIYGGLMVMGFAVGCFKIYAMFEWMINMYRYSMIGGGLSDY